MTDHWTQRKHRERHWWQPRDEKKPCRECRGTGKCNTCKGDGCADCDYVGICDECAGSGEERDNA